MKPGMLSWNATRHAVIIFFVPFGAGLAISFSQTRASHNKRDGFGSERATFRDETISVASYFFKMPLLVVIRVRLLSKWTPKIS